MNSVQWSLNASLIFLIASAVPAFGQSYSAGGGSAIGTNTTAVCGGSCTAVGPNSSAYGAGSNAQLFSSAYGEGSYAAFASSAYGDSSTASGITSSAYGNGSVASGHSSSAYGNSSTASGYNSSAYGYFSTAEGYSSSAYGNQSTASGDLSTAIGFKSNAASTNSVALGSGSIADQPNTVSVGSPGSERRITNVAPGINPTDAVNMGQFNDQVNGLRGDISGVARQAYRGIAGVAALTSTAPAMPGKTSINLGVGAYRGYAAGAITASHVTENARWNFNGGVGISGGDPVFRGGVGFSF